MTKILKAVEEGKLKPKKAYKLLYLKKQRKPARFIKCHFYISEIKVISFLINLILVFPISIKLLKRIVGRRIDDESSKAEFMKLTLYKKGVIEIKVNNEVNLRAKAL